MKPDLFWRDAYSYGYYKHGIESKVWQAVCPFCKAEFIEAHICPLLKRQRELEEEYLVLQKKICGEDENEDGGEEMFVVSGPILPQTPASEGIRIH